MTTTGSSHSLVAKQPLASFDKEYEILIVDHSDRRKEIDIRVVQAAIF
jgi:hypothetical protein